MYGEGQGNGYEIRNGELMPCSDTFADGFLRALENARLGDAESAELDDVTTAADFLDRTSGGGIDEEIPEREPTGLDS